MNDVDSRADAEVKRAIGILRGTVSFHTETTLNYLARHEQELLNRILEQASASEEGRKFWQYQLQCYALPSVPPKRSDSTTRESHLARLNAFLVLLHHATRLMRTHRGNPDWAIFELMYKASDRCTVGGLEQTDSMLLASLYAGVITTNAISNEGGSNNELLRYMMEHVEEIGLALDRLSTSDLTIALLEATIDRSVHAGVRSGWL